MKKLLIIPALILTVLTSVSAQGIEFFHGTWQEALEAAFEEEKVIFVDAYTTWCGPCKKMAKNTFTNAEVGEFHNANFINVKLDMESDAGMEWRRKYPVSAYPTLYYINVEEEVVLKTVGAKDPKALLEMSMSAASKDDRSVVYAEKYDAGDRSYEVVYNYVRTLNKANKPSLKISNAYLKEQENLTTEENLRFILEAAVQVDAKSFSLLEANKNKIEKLAGKEEVAKKITEAAHRTAAKAIEYESEDLLKEAQQAMENHVSAEAASFEMRTNMDYALAFRNEDAYLKNAKVYVKKNISDDSKSLMKVSKEIIDYFPNSKNLLKVACDAAEQSVELDPTFNNLINYAQLLARSDDSFTALKVLDDAFKSAGPDKKKQNKVNAIKKQIANS